MTEVVRLPEWKSVAIALAEEDPEPGTVFTHEFLRQSFGINCGDTVESYKAAMFDYLQCIENMKSFLLVEHQIALRSVRGEGYVLVPPSQQTEYGVDAGVHGVRKALRKMNSIISNVRLDRLTDEQIRKNTDARVHAAGLASLFGKSPLLQLTNKG